MRRLALAVVLCWAWAAAAGGSQERDVALARGGALDGVRPRVLVSTDIGGTDPDDFQSLVHLLLYADVLDLEGIVSSPFGPGRLAHILEVVDRYERDFPKLRTWSPRYPTPPALRDISKQGETESAPYAGVRRTTDGSDWIVRCARRADSRPLHVLVWGGLEDLAQALHDAPDIEPKLRVFFIGGPNKKWSVDAFQDIAARHPRLWMIESNATYRGWFVGGRQDGEWDNRTFVRARVAGRGALGDFFVRQLESGVKMGDSPSVARLLRGAPDDPSAESWGGRYVRTWDRAAVRLNRLTTADDRVEQFGVLEIALPLGSNPPPKPVGRLVIENQQLEGHPDGAGSLRFRFSPKDAKQYEYRIDSNVPALDGRGGSLTAFALSPGRSASPSPRYPNWWTDDPAPDAAEAEHAGARTVSRWREAFLGDFANRLTRCTRRADGAP